MLKFIVGESHGRKRKAHATSVLLQPCFNFNFSLHIFYRPGFKHFVLQFYYRISMASKPKLSSGLQSWRRLKMQNGFKYSWLSSSTSSVRHIRTSTQSHADMEVSVEDGVREIKLNRPLKKNAITKDVRRV